MEWIFPNIIIIKCHITNKKKVKYIFCSSKFSENWN